MKSPEKSVKASGEVCGAKWEMFVRLPPGVTRNMEDRVKFLEALDAAVRAFVGPR